MAEASWPWDETGRRSRRSSRKIPSSRKVPRDGGIILAVGQSREEIESIAAQDPFVTNGLAEARVIEFRASQRAPDIQQRIET